MWWESTETGLPVLALNCSASALNIQQAAGRIGFRSSFLGHGADPAPPDNWKHHRRHAGNTATLRSS
jgi:hypothetical protein